MPTTKALENPKLKKRLKELKLRAGHENYVDVSIEARSKRKNVDFAAKLDQRIICGYMCSWNNRNHHGEKFLKGSAAKSIRERGPGSQAKYKCTFLWQHRQDEPLAVFAVLEEDDYGLYFETAPLDDIPVADRVLKQIRSGTLNQFSMGFDYIYDQIEYDEKDDSLVIREFELYEGSVVTIGSDMQTFALRNSEQILNLHDEIEDFVLTLPRKDRALARQLFTRQKALIDIDAFTEDETPATIDKDEPETEPAINYDYLIKNL